MFTHHTAQQHKATRDLIMALLVVLLAIMPLTTFAAPTCDADADGFLKDNRKCGGDDCADDNAGINPGADEICGDSLDNNCNGIVDEGCGSGGDLSCQDGPSAGMACTSDFDCGICISGDTIGAACASHNDCPPNRGPGSQRGTCEVHLCVEDTGSPCTDADGDGFAIEGSDCGAIDCHDAEPTINPGAPEICGNGVDDDCNGQVDDGCTAMLPFNIAAAGDSITQAFGATCTCNTNFFCLLCLLGGDQPEYSWFDGSHASVDSVHDRYVELEATIGADKSAAADGSEMRGGTNNFSVQADHILSQTPVADHIEVLLGGNDICNRDCVNAANCANPLYTDAQWRAALRAGLDKLLAGLPLGSTVYVLSVPRVHDLRQAGLEKQATESGVNCEGVWADFDICTIATLGSALNGESIATRLAGIAERQQRYNEILREEALAYNSNTNGRNPRGIEVVTDYVDETTASIGTYVFGATDIDGGDCFHPSIQGQNVLANQAWVNNPDHE